MTWNINELHELLLHDTLDYLLDFDITVLNETRSLTLPCGFLSPHTILTQPATRNGAPGEGLVIGVKKCINVSVVKWASDGSSLWA